MHAVELLLQARQYGILVLPLHDHKLLGSASFVLAALAPIASRRELRQRLPAHLKVGAVEHIRQLVNLHLPGIRQAAAGGAAADPVPLQQDLFHSRTQRRGYTQLERSGGFAFHVSGEFSELELKLGHQELNMIKERGIPRGRKDRPPRSPGTGTGPGAADRFRRTAALLSSSRSG